jgi:hypothetical protein
MTQKFKAGDYVQIAKDLGPSMDHFRSDCDAIVIGSYRDQYGGSNDHSYTLYLRDSGPCSWYEEEQLVLLEPQRTDLLEVWKEQRERFDIQRSNLDWIFDPCNRDEMLNNPPTASIRGLAACLLITEDDLWGPHGEGITYWTNTMRLRAHARPYLERSSKADWLAYCEELMAKAKS